ncbi:hypothetical protein C1752_08480 [Acaryochloris thomasi RCC1774]|uniref:Uncharacterized protein n=1 Tax=Acaryochloris thomasi RCC1774 TaxID=1764569 RepID=A0A2W1JAL3_9CYAN|nr:hypothetical protein [Acaryochloris thomasi]PZD71038.1 hypothetical protein C1752_08480 [Acaryochloris thomasi RCC1774]
MNLKQFISETLIQITEGIEEAQKSRRTEQIRINPKSSGGINVVTPTLYTDENGTSVFPVTFDVAISAGDRDGVKTLGINVLNGGGNCKDPPEESKSSVSRVTFTVPIAYPLKKAE